MARTRTSHTDLLQILADDNEIQTSLSWSMGCILYWKLGASIVPFNSHFACTFAILTSNRHYKWRNRSARLMFEDKEGSISLKASKRKLQNKSHWTHILTNFWWNRRALHFKTMCVRYCKTINKGFNYISCILFTQEENHTYLKSQALSSPKPALFPIILTQIMAAASHSTQVIASSIGPRVVLILPSKHLLNPFAVFYPHCHWEGSSLHPLCPGPLHRLKIS